MSLFGNSMDSSFVPESAAMLLGFSALAYMDKFKVKQKLDAEGYAHQFIENAQGPQGLIATKGDVMVVAFRGTRWNRPDEMESGYQTEMIDGPGGGRIHSGFAETMLSPGPGGAYPQMQVENAARAFLSEHPRGKIYFTGHSRGGALASISAADTVESDYRIGQHIAGLYTFGQPRTGDGHFAHYLNRHLGDRYHRIVHTLDMAAYLPFPSPLPAFTDGYRHAGNLVTLFADGAMKESGVIASLIDDVKTFIFGPHSHVSTPSEAVGVRGHGMFTNHWLPVYMNALGNAKDIGMGAEFLASIMQPNQIPSPITSAGARYAPYGQPQLSMR